MKRHNDVQSHCRIRISSIIDTVIGNMLKTENVRINVDLILVAFARWAEADGVRMTSWSSVFLE